MRLKVESIGFFLANPLLEIVIMIRTGCMVWQGCVCSFEIELSVEIGYANTHTYVEYKLDYHEEAVNYHHHFIDSSFIACLCSTDFVESVVSGL